MTTLPQLRIRVKFCPLSHLPILSYAGVFTVENHMVQIHSEDKSNQNGLWLARMRAGYLQKWIAPILGQRAQSIVSAYEKGRRIPPFRTAIKLEILYGTPLSELFPSLYEELTREIESAKDRYPSVRKRDTEMSDGSDMSRHGNGDARDSRNGGHPRSHMKYDFAQTFAPIGYRSRH